MTQRTHPTALLPPAPPSSRDPGAPVSARRGVAAALASASAYGLVPLLGRGADALGVSTTTTLAWRFGIAAMVLWGLAAARGARLPRGRVLATCAFMGGVAYAGQSWLFFSALERIDATLVGLLLYAYPALVVALAVALRREPASRRTVAALATSLGGLVLLLGGSGVGTTAAATGVIMALGAALVYATFITLAAGVLARVDPLAALTIITTAASTTLFVHGTVTGEDLVLPLAAVVWVALLAVLGTVASGWFFLVGVRSIGASRTSILSCLEPVVVAVLAVVLWGEPVTATRIAGGLAVLAAVVVLEAGGVGLPSRPLPGLVRRLPALARR